MLAGLVLGNRSFVAEFVGHISSLSLGFVVKQQRFSKQNLLCFYVVLGFWINVRYTQKFSIIKL